MKKSVIRLIVIVLLVSSLLLLSSCKGRVAGGENPIDTATAARMVQTGTQGLELRILPNTPPAVMYDQNELITIVELNNRGNSDLYPQDCFVQITGFDTNILRGDISTPKMCSESLDILEGKNLYNVYGGVNMLEFRAPNVQLPFGVFEYTPNLNFLTCYRYHTMANPQVCLDPLFYQITSEQKNCIPHGIGMSGQGGPVGVNYVGVNMVGGQAIFEISITNFGTGRVLHPDADISRCGETSLEYEDVDKVRYDVSLMGGSPVNCKPSDKIVRLTNGNGKMVCRFNINGNVAFETPLLIDLDYSYIQSQTKQVKIVRTPE
jgi:hypothetical protein